MRMAQPLAVLAAGAVALGLTSAPVTAAPASPVTIEVLSNRADLISGGDALVQIVLAEGAYDSQLRVRLNDQNITDEFAVRDNGRYMGLVTGLEIGDNTLTAELPRRRGARITITNHPAGGPVFAGPQVLPWTCATEEAGLGPPQDEQCSAPVQHDFLYSPTSKPTALLPYDPENPPSNVATTTTDQGETVPFIVRRERGTLDRGIYDIWVLYYPEQPWKPWQPQRGWNGKLLYSFIGSCSVKHSQTNASTELTGRYVDVIDNAPAIALSRGFALATSGLNVLGNNCNEVVAAESVMTVKERLAETYGPIRYTIGDGGSGGAIQQYSIAANYPGLLDGLHPVATFPDIWTVMPEMFDCSLLMPYFNANPALWPTESQQATVTGHQTRSACEAWIASGFPTTLGDPRYGCDGTAYGQHTGAVPQPEYAYDPEANPDGVRCTLQDYQAAIFGSDPDTGDAPRPFDNIGVQYGLTALHKGLISPEQFVDLNAEIGGLDIDFQPIGERSHADPAALDIAYRSGRVTHAGELAKVPIFDIRGDGNFDVHTLVHSQVVRDRLEAANGGDGNYVYWRSPGPMTPHPPVIEESFHLLDEWLTAIEADSSPDRLADKVVRHRPSGLVDRCFVEGVPARDEACPTSYATPRIAAGSPSTNDVLKCALTPLDRDSYPVEFTDEQWDRLQRAFPRGVCDWSRPGVGQRPPGGPWMSFAGGPGGRPLGDPPVSEPLRPGSAHREDR